MNSEGAGPGLSASSIVETENLLVIKAQQIKNRLRTIRSRLIGPSATFPPEDGPAKIDVPEMESSPYPFQISISTAQEELRTQLDMIMSTVSSLEEFAGLNEQVGPRTG